MKTGWIAGLVLGWSGLLLFPGSSLAGVVYTYNGNGSDSGDGCVGKGHLTLTDNGTTVTGTFYRGNGVSSGQSFTYTLVIYIDSITGGFSSTAMFGDTSDAMTKGISGYNSTQRSTATFAGGFNADYAIALTVTPIAPVRQTSGLYQLQGGSRLNRLKDITITPSGDQSASSYTFSFDFQDIGLGPGSGNHFRIESTYVMNSGSRYLASFQDWAGSPTAGFHDMTFQTYGVYGVEPVPEMANAALIIFGGIGAGGATLARVRRRTVRHPSPA